MNKITLALIYTVIISGGLTRSAIARSPSIQLVSSNIVVNNTNSEVFELSGNSKQDNVVRILIIAGLLSGVGTLGWYLFRYQQFSKASPIPRGHLNRTLLDRVSPQLRRQLLRLVNDPKTANRLLVGIHKHHSDRSPNWLAEKAIYDLKRGR
ncbi:hypothetical protein IQ255_19440 [Pleurocapsales cyanobacterium LEGE 10410]|nr:hypothetical protein [Pleurocapsales cyanobacterium LEGE 10410]